MSRQKILFLILIVFIFSPCLPAGRFFGVSEAKASGNVFGWAWSSNIGWISFNKDGLGDISGGGGDFDYGVSIGTDGNLTGYAWSSNIGWIKFDPDGPYPANPSHSACVNLPGKTTCDGAGDYTVTGWARTCSVFNSTCSQTTNQVCNVNSDCPTEETCMTRCSGELNTDRGNWDGWIELHNISIDTSATPAEFHYWVWGGSDDSSDTTNSEAVIGWGIFNCIDTGNCTISNFKAATTFSALGCNDSQQCVPGGTLGPCTVENETVDCNNQPPQIDQVDSVVPNQPLNTPQQPPAPPLTTATFNTDYCVPAINFGWAYFDNNIPSSPETKYEFQVATDSNFSSSSIVIDIINCGTSFSNTQSAYVTISPKSSKNDDYCPGAFSTFSDLSYKQTYWWRVIVYNDKGKDSGWITAAESFTTKDHPYPHADFTVSPSTPSPVTLVNGKASFSFIDSSKCYDISSNPPNACNDPTKTGIKYTWTFGDGNTCIDTIDPTCHGDASHTYTTTGTKTVKLQVCDSSDYCCPKTNNVTVSNPLNVPQYQEISPF